jgi:hypothetical protein
MKFFSSCREKVCSSTIFHPSVSNDACQYGDVFTYKLFGVNMTAAMGIKGNHFVLGGDSKALSAAEAYTVASFALLSSKWLRFDIVYSI